MADCLYKTGEFFIDGEKGSIHQLEGRDLILLIRQNGLIINILKRNVIFIV